MCSLPVSSFQENLKNSFILIFTVGGRWIIYKIVPKKLCLGDKKKKKYRWDDHVSKVSILNERQNFKVYILYGSGVKFVNARLIALIIRPSNVYRIHTSDASVTSSKSVVRSQLLTTIYQAWIF